MKRITLIIILIYSISLGISCNSSPGDNHINDKHINNEKGLVALGQLWGFLKYHHPVVAEGQFDWDMELIKRIPIIVESKSENEWKSILDNWLDSLPPIPINPEKKIPSLEFMTKPNYGELFNPEYLLPQTIDKIKHILDNAVISSNHYVDVKNGEIHFDNELPYEHILFPDLSYRLLALFRHWNIINYFFPYRDLCDEKWSEVLAQMLPEFINVTNQEEYFLACLKLHVMIDDSHGFFVANNSIFYLKEGLLHPPLKAKFIENQLVVTELIDGDEYTNANIKIGDVITQINGKSVDEIIKNMLPYTPASNYEVKLRNISSKILRTNSNTIYLTLLHENQPTDIILPCYDIQKLSLIREKTVSKQEGYQIINNNIGYVLPSNCKVEERDQGIEKVLSGTRGLIIDMRCYPGDYISFPFLNRLDQWSYPFSLVTNAMVAYPGYFFVINEDKDAVKKIEKKQNAYENKVVIIVNEQAQSQSEDIILGLQLATNVTVIGSTSAGADGAVTRFNLPCGIITYMTGKGVYYPDRSDLQRKGVKIDEYILPTIDGIKTGTDELLNRAIAIIEESY